jgi:hypothetical protein
LVLARDGASGVRKRAEYALSGVIAERVRIFV